MGLSVTHQCEHPTKYEISVTLLLCHGAKWDRQKMVNHTAGYPSVTALHINDTNICNAHIIDSVSTKLKVEAQETR